MELYGFSTCSLPTAAGRVLGEALASVFTLEYEVSRYPFYKTERCEASFREDEARSRVQPVYCSPQSEHDPLFKWEMTLNINKFYYIKI